MTTQPSPHLEARLQHDIDVIRTRLLQMADLDEHALTQALQALLQRDRQLAYSVILRDQDIDAFETELDRLCIEFIVRHQPVAAHLRFVYSASKIVSELERIGDYAESIARQVLLLGAAPAELPADRFSEIANLAVPMLHNAMRAFLDRNPDLARTTMACEPRVNQVRDTLNAELLALGEQGRLPLDALPLLLTIARRFERVSDQATNICEEALYVATGEYLRHVPREGFRVLFVDEANACLSQMAEAIGNSLGARRFTFCSAGVVAGAIDPQTIQFLAEKGMDISHHTAKPADHIPQRDRVQVVVALCREAQQALPKRPSKSVGLDWFTADPSKVRGTPEKVRAAYEQAFEILTNHIRDLVAAILGNEQRPTHERTNLPN